MRRKEFLLLLAILALGAFFRFYHITTTPPGLYPDEAMNGSNGLEALHTGHFAIFYPDNNGREGLFINIQAVSVWLFGREAWALRIVAALFGTLTILGVYLAAKELFENATVALLPAFFIATSYWHANFSRIGFRAITTPFFLSFGLAFLLRGFRKNSMWDMVWAGIFIGLGFQGYIAFRFVPFVLAVPILWQLGKWYRSRKLKTQNLSSHSRVPSAVILFLFITFVAALPIGWYFFKHPADFIGRSKEVSILSAPLPVLEFAKTNALTLGMFFIRGDCNDRHNYACHPELNLVVALFFLIGIAASLKILFNRRRPSQERMASATLFGWLVFMSLPETLTREGIPHALRSIGMIPPIMILAGLGAYAAFRFIGNRFSRRTTLAIVILLFIYIPFQTYRDYFIVWAARPQTADAFATDMWHLGQYLDSTPQNIIKYVIADLGSDQNGGLPVVAETVAFATDTFRPQERAQKNLTYILSRDALSKIEIPAGQPVLITPLQKNDPETLTIIREKFPQFQEIRTNDFLIFQNF